MEPQNLITPTDPITTIEPNDTIPLANEIKLDSSSPIVVSGQIGDKPGVIPTNDVDLFEVELNAGDTLLANINAAVNGSSLDAVLTIFDINGNQLDQNEDNSFDTEGVTAVTQTEPDPLLYFLAFQAGTYYVGVSSSGNLNYNPTNPGSGTGNSSGIYSLELSLDEFVPDVVATERNDSIRSANSIELDSLSPVVISGEIGDNPRVISTNDVDLFEVKLNAGDTLLADIDAQLIGSSLNSVLSVFDINGNLLAQNDDNSFEVEGVPVTEFDSYLPFTVVQDGTYYVGVSSSGNLDYNPTVPGSGTGNSSGSYRLELSIGDEI